jgi:ABC-type transport system substrate-binding protein
MPLPQHILEKPYLEDKATFADLPHWGHEFVGTGPFKLREMVNGSHVILEANDQYVLGRPKIDVIEVKITSEASAMMTNVLAGAADMALGARISVDEALQVRDQWRDGKVEFAQTNWRTDQLDHDVSAVPQPEPRRDARRPFPPRDAARPRPPAADGVDHVRPDERG